ncbi:uncharacterized protein DEA37_0012843 [Paragonimus westermani]|uniref:Integrase catalytic domain-containing protein n=1 Tax=Paragonimus westermani TaxID=34504 RepID=A0A5J4NIC9_9TREM|nr:uncharacterized protein DEA37_0012843 [Paragonimus westermani]
MIPNDRRDACTVAAAIGNEWIARYGAPIRLHLDRGAAFESRLLKKMCRLLAVMKTRTTPYYPQESLSTSDHTRNLRENLRTAFRMTQGHMNDAQRRQKEQYDQHHQWPSVLAGCRAWLCRPKAGVGGPAKLHRQ